MLFEGFLDLLFPKRCVGCFLELKAGALCAPCHAALPPPSAPRCPHCAVRVPFGVLASPCVSALGIKRLFIGGSYRHALLRAAVDALKYEGVRDLVAPLATTLVAPLETAIQENCAAPLLVPIPLHTRRLRDRGFNQSELLARTLSTLLPAPIARNAIIRTRNTKQQIALASEARKENLRNAFRANIPESYRTRTFLLIDDVITTGATIRESSRALRRDGVKEIWAAAVAQS